MPIWGSRMTDFGHRYHVGFTSVLRRCVTTVAVITWLPSAATANIEKTSGVAAALLLIERFEAVCATQVEQGEIADKSDQVLLAPDRIASLAQALGYSKPPAAIWSDTEARWYQVQHSLEKPEICQLVSFQISFEDLLTSWEAEFQNGERWQSFSELRTEHATLIGGHASSHFAIRRDTDHEFMVGASFYQFQQVSYVSLSYRMTDLTTAHVTPRGDQ